MLKLKMMLCVMMLPLVVVGYTSKQVCQSVREATTASGVDMQPPRLADTAERDYFLPSKLITMQKQLEGTQKYINEQMVSCHIDGQLHAIIVVMHASSGV